MARARSRPTARAAPAGAGPCRQLVLVLGDQLDERSAALDGLDPRTDRVWMAEVAGESTHVWSGKARIALFLSAMRHFRDTLRARGLPVEYVDLEEEGNTQSLAGELARALQRLRPGRVVVVEPGEWRVAQDLARVAAEAGVPLEVRTDRHFYATVDEFREHAEGRRQVRQEWWYRELRRKHGVLLDAAGGPEGGEWNYDADNRASFGKAGPPLHAPPRAFPPDALTREVLALVGRRFAGHPGALEAFDWPVTRAQALQALEDFVRHRLPWFGEWQDAMWAGEPWLFHSRLSAALNLKLLDPREVVGAAEAAWRAGRVPLASAEGFIRQVLGWREYVRGIYWTQMPSYLERNALGAGEPLPAWFWTGDTPMRCLQDALGQTLRLGYAHHIQRLMVTGLYTLLLGVAPKQVHAWYLAVYVDAVEWVELPNVLGMSQHADGGLMASKPYVATGKYIERMGNHCASCPYDPAKATGADACPFTTLYWDFLLRHEARLARNPRMGLQVKNLARLAPAERKAIAAAAQAHRAAMAAPAAKAGLAGKAAPAAEAAPQARARRPRGGPRP
ncbi:MAG: cryptochrome/photolyase family protein [Planctomycetia bacterium]